MVEPEQARWDDRHQVLGQERLRTWQLFWAAKWLELRFHLRPRRLWAPVVGGDRLGRRQRQWVFRHIALVWAAEVVECLLSALARVPVKDAGAGGTPSPSSTGRCM